MLAPIKLVLGMSVVSFSRGRAYLPPMYLKCPIRHAIRHHLREHGARLTPITLSIWGQDTWSENSRWILRLKAHGTADGPDKSGWGVPARNRIYPEKILPSAFKRRA